MVKKLIIGVFLISLCFCNQGFAASYNSSNDPAWIIDKQKLEKIQECSDVWDILWPWAKSGNLEARTMLYTYTVVSSAYNSKFLLPGESGDLVTKMRNILILGVHSEDYKETSNSDDAVRSVVRSMYKQYEFDARDKGKKFLQCLDSKGTKNCSKLAVEAGLVPSFENYAKQIDAFVNAGMEVQCTN